MQAIKKVFSPGNQKDDEIMYGTPGQESKSAAQTGEQAASGPYTEGVPQGESAPTLHTDPSGAGSEKKDHGVLRQILNPGGDKYDEQRFGENATTQRNSPATGAMSSGAAGSAAGAGSVRPEDSNIGKENVQNPVSSQRPEEATRFDNYGGGAAPTRVNKHSEGTSSGPNYGSAAGTGYDNTTSADSSHRDRDAALAGAGAAAGLGGAGYAASRDKPSTYEPSGAQPNERSFPLGGGAASESNRPTSSIYSDTSRNPTAGATSSSAYNEPSGLSRNQATGPSSTSGYTDPSNTSRSGTQGLGSSGATTAAGGAAAATAVGGLEEHGHHGHGHNFDGDPCPPGEEPHVSGVPQHFSGPHSTLTANRLDPHVPGEFPGEDGQDVHAGHGSSLRGAGAGAPLSSTGATGSSLPSTGATDRQGPYRAGETGLGSSLGSGSAAPAVPERSEGHHLGRDAAAAGGLGAAGVGAYELGKDRNTPTTAQPSYGSSTTSQPSGAYHAGETGFGSSLGSGNSAPSVPERSEGHHVGRDAAAAGGLGAAGAGAYELGKDRNTAATAQPSSSSALPGSTNSTQPGYGSQTSTQPGYSSQALPERSAKDHHYGRDAALGAGGLGAGAAGYEALKDRNEPRDVQQYSSTGSTGGPPSQQYGAAPVSSYDDQRAAPPGTTHSSTQQPLSQQPPTQSHQPEHHYGRDAALGGGAAAAGYGAYKMTEGAGADDTGPASKTVGPHKSNVLNVLDPRVQPEPEHQKQHSTAGPWHSDTVNKMDPKVQSDPSKAPINQHGYRDADIKSAEPQSEHHYGRDTALAGGAGAAGVGAYEASKHHGENAPTSQNVGSQTTASPSYPGHTLNRDVEASRAAEQQRLQQQPEHHYGRDAALGGAGAGALGAGAYEASKHGEKVPMTNQATGQPYNSGIAGYDPSGATSSRTTQQQQQPEHHYGRDAAAVGGVGALGAGAYEADKHRGNTAPTSQNISSQGTSAAPHGSNTTGYNDPRATSDPRTAQQQQPEHHYGRDAAAVGGAGAAAYAGKEIYDDKEQKKLEKEHEKEAKKEAKEHEKEAKHEQKEHEKDLKHQQKEHEKQHKADEKERAKAAEKAEKERAKEQEKHDKVVAKEHEKAEHQHAKEEEKRMKAEEKQDEKLEKEREKQAHKHEHNKLHKDPPEEKKPSLIHRILHPHEKEETRKSVEGDRPKGLDYKDADEARHAQHVGQLEDAGVVGGAGAGTAAAAGTLGQHHGVDDRGHSTEYPTHAGSGHQSGLASQGGLPGGSDAPSRDQGIVTEPHTGLPMNVGKYGSGAGGTDGASQIPGYHEAPEYWEGIRKGEVGSSHPPGQH